MRRVSQFLHTVEKAALFRVDSNLRPPGSWHPFGDQKDRALSRPILRPPLSITGEDRGWLRIRIRSRFVNHRPAWRIHCAFLNDSGSASVGGRSLVAGELNSTRRFSKVTKVADGVPRELSRLALLRPDQTAMLRVGLAEAFLTLDGRPRCVSVG